MTVMPTAMEHSFDFRSNTVVRCLSDGQRIHVGSECNRPGPRSLCENSHNAGSPHGVHVAAKSFEQLRNAFRGAMHVESQFRVSVKLVSPFQHRHAAIVAARSLTSRWIGTRDSPRNPPFVAVTCVDCATAALRSRMRGPL